MRRPSKIGMARSAILPALALGATLLAPGRSAEAQPPSNSGDAPAAPRSSAILGQDRRADADQDSRMLVAHGLEMAIEGSTLQGLAQRASGVGLGPAVDPRPSTAGVVGSSSVAAPAPAPPATARAPVAASTAGTGYTGGAGETVSGRQVGNGNEIRPATGATVAPAASLPSPTAVDTPTVPLTAAQAADSLRRQAMRSFEASERLLGGMGGEGPEMKLQKAASRYAATLKAIATEPVIRPGTVANPPAAGRAAEAVGADPASVALINHAVREALGAMKIRQMSRQSGGAAGPAGMKLMEHAQMMESEGRSMIRAFAGNGEAGPVATASGIVGSPNGTVQALAQQANELLAAIQGLAP